MTVKRTLEQKRYDAQAPKNEVGSIQEVTITPSGGNTFVILLRNVDDKVRDLVLDALDIDISGYNHILDSSAVKHALNRHKNDKIPLTVEHFNLISDIVKNADRIKCGRKNTRKLNTIVYMKKYKNRVFYVEEIRSGRHQLAMNTMYLDEKAINKKDTPAGEFSGEPTNS